MSLKSFVNNKPSWDAFCTHLNEEIIMQHRKLEQASDMQEMYQAQGAIATLRRLTYLRDKVNGE